MSHYPYRQPDPIPQPPQPGRVRRFLSWYRERSRLTQIILALAALFVLGAAISGIVQGTQESFAPAPTVASQPTQAPAKPTATPTHGQAPTRVQIDNLLTSSGSEATVVSYDQQSATLILQTGFGFRVTVTQSAVEGAIQDAQVLFWKQHWYFASIRVNAVQFQQSGPDVPLGYGLLKYATASGIDWSAPPDLWDKYDQKFIDPSVPNF